MSTSATVPGPTATPPTRAAQDYLKAIYRLESRTREEERSGDGVSTSALAARLGVRAPSASGMVSRLAQEGLVKHLPYRGVRLTPAGRRLALAVVRRHRLLETLLVEELGMRWDEVHAEAEALEHAVSDRVLDRIAAKLGEPARDPHGDPIPSAGLDVDVDDVDETAAHVLERLPVGAKGRVVRVLDAGPDLLAYLDRQGIALGDELEMMEPEPFGGSLRVRLREHERSLGRLAARALEIEIDS